MSSPNSTTADVDARITKASDFARPICVKLREIIRKVAPNLEECLKWGMPAYKGNGLVCCIGAFKQHVTLHFFRGAEFGGAHALLKDGADAANSRGIKFTSLKEVKAAAVAGLVKEGVKIDGTEKTAKPKTKRAELPVPPAFTAALRKNPRAKKAFDALPPSSRREFSEWIGGAKKEETVQRRLEKALTMLAEGRRMNDEYR